MCNICSIAQTFDPQRHAVPEFQGPLQTETDDAASGLDTDYTIDVGGRFAAEIDRGGDRDWIAVTLDGGSRYDIAVMGDASGGGTLSDPYLQVYNAAGELVDDNDDGGPGLDPLLSFVPRDDGTYYLAIRAFSVTQTGTYTVEVTEGATAREMAEGAGTLDELSEYLVAGYWEGEGEIARSFNTARSSVITVDIDGLNAEGKQLARWAMEAWERVADISFSEVSRGADITFGDDEAGAFSTAYLSWDGELTRSTVDVSRDWIDDYGDTIEGYAFSTYVHELGHALGLGHMGAYNGNARYGRDETFTNDSWQISVMSYFNQNENTSVDASFAAPITPMMADILAIQSIYGVSQETAGNTVWGARSNFDGYLGTYFSSLTGGETRGTYEGADVAYTIFDAGGRDLWNLSHSAHNNRIDMRAEQFSDVDGLTGNIGIARDTQIEDLRAGAGDDRIIANDAGNKIWAGNGSDEIDGGSGNDTLLGEEGGDALYGRDGNDVLRGGFNEGRDFDYLYGGAGNDKLFGGAGFDRLYGEAGNDILHGGGQADNMIGGGGDDRLFGNNGQDRMLGGAGNDTLQGGGGHDRLFGGAAQDELDGGTGADKLFGQAGSDRLYGSAGNDTIYGNGGFDTIEGGAGDDLLFGRLNGDHFVFRDGHGDDTIGDFNAVNGREKIDLSEISIIRSVVDLNLGNSEEGAARQLGSNVVIDTGGGDQITLANVQLTALDASDFVF